MPEGEFCPHQEEVDNQEYFGALASLKALGEAAKAEFAHIPEVATDNQIFMIDPPTAAGPVWVCLA